MEEEKDIIYDLSEGGERSVEGSESGERRAEGGELLEGAGIGEDSDCSDNADNADNATNKLRQMIEEVGAETLLEIIRDNRNAAIRQIISEVEASQDHALQSGVSAARGCNSIFDLAAMA